MRTKKGFQTWELLRHGRVNVSSSSSFGPSIAPRSEAARLNSAVTRVRLHPVTRVLKCYVELGAKTIQIEHVRKSTVPDGRPAEHSGAGCGHHDCPEAHMRALDRSVVERQQM